MSSNPEPINVYNEKPVYEFVHSCHVDYEDGDAVVAKVNRHHMGISTPEVIVIDKPKRSFYLTKPGLRTHKYKKEYEYMENLDKYDVYNHELPRELFHRLNGFYPRRNPQLNQLCDSPYVYGADIHIEVLIKGALQKTFEKSGLRPSAVTTGFFDTEADMLETNGKDINLITVTHENKVYTAIWKKFFKKRIIIDGKDRFVDASLDELIKLKDEVLEPHIESIRKALPKVRIPKFEYQYFLHDDLLECIKWIFEQIHVNMTDFIGIWNMGYDIPQVIRNIQRLNGNVEDIMCYPGLAKKYKKVKYDTDHSKVDHFTKKWDWFHSTSGSQFTNATSLYSLLRTVIGKETSYKLDDILHKNIGVGKLTFKDADPIIAELTDTNWHRYMQRNEFLKYILYNQFDCISLQIMEWKNRDEEQMVMLAGPSRLCKWSRQTRKAADDLYFDILQEGKVLVSTGRTMFNEFDWMLGKTGGAVLRPEKTYDLGINIFRDMTGIKSLMRSFVNDIDFSAFYPTVECVMNISKETKLNSAYLIEGMDKNKTQRFFSLFISTDENSVQIMNTYFGLPNYSDMNKLFLESLKNNPVCIEHKNVARY